MAKEPYNLILGNKDTQRYKYMDEKDVADAVKEYKKKLGEPNRRKMMAYVITPYGVFSSDAIFEGRIPEEAKACAGVKLLLDALNETIKNKVNGK